MSCILNIETSTKICSVALSLDDESLFAKENKEKEAHSSLLGVFVAEAMEYARNAKLQLDAVAVSSGPGSYTGLRIGVSEAKGLCYGLGVPLIAISSLEIMASEVIRSGQVADYYCPMIDARRMEVYAAVFNSGLNLVGSITAEIIDKDSFEYFLSRGKVLFLGDGSDKCKGVIESSNAAYVSGIFPHASSMIPLSIKYFHENKFEDVAYFEPNYLKEYQAVIAKNKVLGNM